jgi:hypothetical protein
LLELNCVFFAKFSKLKISKLLGQDF